MKSLIEQLQSGTHLSEAQCGQAVEFLLSTEAEDALKCAFLKALHAKGETAEELFGFARSMLARAVDPKVTKGQKPLLDVCGTGGDGMQLFNVSTTSMFLLAAGGISIVKHGNRGITSKSGGADVLEALGIRIDLPPDALKECVETVGIGFLFAPNYHPAFKAVAGVRKTLAQEGTKTIFNLLGPLLNPVQPDFQLVGVFNHALLETYARVLSLLGRAHAWVLNSSGADEILPFGITEIAGTKEGSNYRFNIDPRELGIQPCTHDSIRGGDREQNADTLLAILSGKDIGPKCDTVLLNAAAGFTLCGIAPSFQEGIELAKSLIQSGAAIEKLERLKVFQAG